jgi:hypothetical protein
MKLEGLLQFLEQRETNPCSEPVEATQHSWVNYDIIFELLPGP